MTRKACYEKLLTMEAVQADAEIVDVLNAEITALTKRTEREKKNREAKNPEGDTLKPVVLSVMTHDWQTVDAIMAKINDDSATRQKVINRIGNLVNEGLVQKAVEKTEDKTVTTYALA